MGMLLNRIKITIEPGFLLYTAILALVIPIRLLLAWYLAVIIHEMGHYTALRLLHIQIFALKVELSGITLLTERIGGLREIVCAAAGPVFGFSILLIADYLPCTAAFACIHSAYNLLPIYPLDGGRIVRCLFQELKRHQAKIPLKTSITNSTIIKKLN